MVHNFHGPDSPNKTKNSLFYKTMEYALFNELENERFDQNQLTLLYTTR